MSSAREEILQRVQAATRSAAATQIERSYRRSDERPRHELVSLFCERVDDYRAEIERVPASLIRDRAAAAAARHGARRLVMPPGLPDPWRPAQLELVADDSLTPHELDAVDGVITGCTIAIAETGTIILTSAPHEGRRALSLVPDLHICIVTTDQVVGTVPEAISNLGPIVLERRPPLTLISGPSATSDIELQRVEGVHGPRKLVILLSSEEQ